jgi:hypothetical protein
MPHNYLTLDPRHNTSGIRCQFEGYIDLNILPVSSLLQAEIRDWLSEYPSAGSGRNTNTKAGFSDHDIKGLVLRKKLAIELGSTYKVKYYSDIKMKELWEKENGEILEL